MQPGSSRNTGKTEVYKRVKIAGMVLFIPIVLAAGPISGYVVGTYITRRFHLPFYVTMALIAVGFASGIMETVRIIKQVLNIEKKT